MDKVNKFQWYVVTAISGQEESIIKALKEKMNNYGYSENVKEIRVFNTKKVMEETFSKNDPLLPTSLKNTRTIKWQSLSDGRYKRIKTKINNRFPGYIFINANLNYDVWYAIRNTVGILGFVGSSGKGSLPIPCSIEEYEKLFNDSAKQEYAVKIQTSQVLSSPDNVSFHVGQSVEIISGSFATTIAKIINVDQEKKVAKIEFEFFGRVNSFDVSFADLRLIN